MAVALRERARENREGHLTRVDVRLNPGAYATGGVAFDPTRHGEGNTVVQWNIPVQGDRHWEYLPGTKLLKSHVVATGAEVANATDLSGVDLRATFWLEP